MRSLTGVLASFSSFDLLEKHGNIVNDNNFLNNEDMLMPKQTASLALKGFTNIDRILRSIKYAKVMFLWNISDTVKQEKCTCD